MQEGILLIDKPSGFTSFDVIAVLRGMTHIKRIGHSGTLDPMATGVLPCLFGSATRLCDKMPVNTKVYEATILWGEKTDTGDVTGKVLESDGIVPTDLEIQKALPKFIGTVSQIPPMYSAIKVNGRPLYSLAHQGKEIERKPRLVDIYDIKKENDVFTVSCSTGTYIRTLFEDIAKELNTFACLKSLRRISANGFDISECISWEEAQTLAKENKLTEKIIPSETAFRTLPIMQVSAWHARMLKNGVQLKKDKFPKETTGSFRIYSEKEFLGIAVFKENAEQIFFRNF